MSPDAAISAVAVRQFGIFTTEQAKAAGYTRGSIRRRCKSGLWLVPYRGVYALASAPACWEQNVFATTAAYGRTAVASGVTASVLLNLLDQRSHTIDVTLPPGQHREARAGVVVHQTALKRSDVRIVQGIRVTAPNRTLADCAAVLAPEQLEAALDTAVFRGLTSFAALDRHIRERRLEHRPGVGRLRRMIADRTKGTSQSELERIFFRKLKKSRLPLPTRQFPVGRRFIDISYPEKRIIIELDGQESRYLRPAFQGDRRRQNEVVLALPGWTLLRFTWDDVVDNWPYVEHTLQQALYA